MQKLYESPIFEDKYILSNFCRLAVPFVLSVSKHRQPFDTLRANGTEFWVDYFWGKSIIVYFMIFSSNMGSLYMT